MAVVETRLASANLRGVGVAAAVDIGSYSVHLLVAEITPDELRIRHDESAFLGLGRTIDTDGVLGGARPILVETIAGFAARALAFGAESMTVVGTDPLRRARDAAMAIDEIRAATGVEVATLTHEEEACLALVGVHSGRRLRRDIVMIDVGGGSTEILTAGPRERPMAVGLPLGATRLTGMHIAHDPPTSLELEALHAEVAEVLELAPSFEPEQLVAVGGTARSLLRIGPPLANRVLRQSRIHNALELIGSVPSTAIAERHGVRLSRARVLAAGAAILAGALDRYDLDRLRVASGGLREGLVLAAHHAGSAWRTELGRLARGWMD